MIDAEALDPSSPHPAAVDTTEIEWVSRDGSLAAFVQLSVRPVDGCSWFVVVVRRPEVPPMVIVDWDLPLVTQAFEFRGSGIWADLVCETPIEHWTIGLEAFGLVVDPEEVLTAELFGQPIPLGFDLDVESQSAPDLFDSGFAYHARVTGDLLVGDERIEFDAQGVRRRWWGSFEPAREPCPQDLPVQGQVSVAWPGRAQPEVRGWVLGVRPGWVTLSR